MFSFYKLVVGHTRPFHFIRHGEHMAMASTTDSELELDLFGPVDDTPLAFTPIPYGIWKMDSPLFSLCNFLTNQYIFFIL
jgi:hypothetical protein